MRNNSRDFIAQHRRQMIIYFPLAWLIPTLIAIIIMITGNLSKDELNIFIAFLVGSFLLMSVIFYLGLHYYHHRLQVRDDEIVLLDIKGHVIKRVKKEDITRIVYYVWHSRSSVPYLVIEDRVSENKAPHSILNKKGEFIKVDVNKEKVDAIQRFYGGEIVNLPEKYK